MRRCTYNGWPTLEWHHKDGGRMYWAVATWRITEALEPELADSYDEWWYEIHRSRSGGRDTDTEIYSGRIETQPGLEPEPHEILADFMAQVQKVAFGFAQSRDEWYGARGEEEQG